MKKIIVSNIRVPEEDWLSFRAAAAGRGMSINEYIIYLGRLDSIKSITGTDAQTSKKGGYDAMDKFLNRKITGKPMGMSDEDKAIYDF